MKRQEKVQPEFMLNKYARIVALCVAFSGASLPAQALDPVSTVAVGPQYDTAHVYVAPQDMDRFAASFLATFGGQSTKQIVTIVTPTPSSTIWQALQTPVGTISLFGFKTPIPYPFGDERTGYPTMSAHFKLISISSITSCASM